MDSDVDPEKFSGIPENTDDESVVPDAQINPVTLMTSNPPFVPVDDQQTVELECIDGVVPQADSSDTVITSTRNADSALSNVLIPSTHVIDEQIASVAAWVESTTAEVASPGLERSPSLPSTLIEPQLTRSRRNSAVSTICDQQQSILSDALTSQQVSFSNEIQRSLSVPTTDQLYPKEDNDLILVLHLDKDQQEEEDEEEGEDAPMQFLPVPESEDSEVDKKPIKLPLQEPEPVKLENRPSSSKISSNVSFHASVSFEPSQRLSVPPRRRRNSATSGKPKTPTLQRSLSHMTSTQTSSLHSRLLRRNFETALSMPTGDGSKAHDTTRQSSSVSDNVFHSPSDSSSSRAPRFRGTLSSASYLSSNRNTSIISDVSGRSGIESESIGTKSIDNDRSFPLPSSARLRSLSTSASETPSTQSVPTSTDDDDDDDVYFSAKGNDDSDIRRRKQKVVKDKRRDVLKQLMWLLEKKTTIYARAALGHRKSFSSPRQQQKSSSNVFVEFCSSFRSSNAQTTIPRRGSDASPRNVPTLYSSFADQAHQMHSLPLTSPPSSIDPLDQSYTSVLSAHSDSNTPIALINSKPTSRHSATGITSLSNSLHHSRKRPHYRRNLSAFNFSGRDRKNSVSKSDQQTTGVTSEQEPEPDTPPPRQVESILNEHLLMINQLLSTFTLNASVHHSTQSSSFRDFLYTRLNELSQQNPMNQRCSRLETKAFIDLITNLHLNCAHHYSFLTDSVKQLLITNNDTVHFTNRASENEDDAIRDGHIASNESSNASSPCLTRYTSTESKGEIDEDGLAFDKHPLRFFRTLSPDYIADCERIEDELKNLFNKADEQHILYCLKHVDSGHTNDSLGHFHRRLDALFVWFNLYYELTISVKKLSGLLRCDECEDWPQLRFRSVATSRERKAKRAEEDEYYYESTDDESDDEEGETDTDAIQAIEDEEEEDENDIIPKNHWPEEPLDHFSRLRISDDSTPTEANTTRIHTLDRIACYRNFVYYMDKRSYQVKYDGLARTLIERIAPVLVKTRLALLQTNDRRKIKIEQIFAGASLSDFQPVNTRKSDAKISSNADEPEDQLVDLDNPVEDEELIRHQNLGELTIDKWLLHVLKSCPTMKTICSSTEELLKNNWLELHEQLGLPSLLPMYFFIVNVVLDVMNECLRLYNKPYMNNDNIEIDSLCRQQLVREAKLVLRDALATRLYSVRMMEQFISPRKILHELAEFDENTVKIYTHYKQFLSTVCINRNFGPEEDDDMILNNEGDSELYYYVDEETSELIKEYYFSRDLTVTLGNRTEIRDLCIDFSTLSQRILTQLKEELNDRTEKYYQTFAIDLHHRSHTNDGSYSADVIVDTNRPASFYTSASVPADILHTEGPFGESTASFSEQKKNDIIERTREFRREFDVIKQRITRVCNLVKTLLDDFSIAAEFRCLSNNDLWQQLRLNSYTRIKINLDSSDTDDIDNFYVFVPPWLSNEKSQVEKLLSIVCSEPTPLDETNKTSKMAPPAFMIFLPKKSFHRQKLQWTGEVLYVQPSETTKFALNSTEISPLHLVVLRHDQWQTAVDLFLSHMGFTRIQLMKKLPRDEGIRLTFDQVPEYIEKLSLKLTELVRTLNTIWDQDSTKIYLTEIVKFDQFAIESKLVDLVLYVYNSGFDLFGLLHELIPPIAPDNEEIREKFFSITNEFFCEWCKCVTKKVKYTLVQHARTARSKVLRPRWLSPGINFLKFLAQPGHLQLLSDEEYKKLIREMPATLDVLYGNHKARSSSVSSTSTHLSHARSHGGHRRVDSGGRSQDILSAAVITPHDRIAQKIRNLDNELEKKSRERKLIGQPFLHTNSSTTPDPVISLRIRNIDFPWRRGTRIGKGGAGVAFRAINCSNGSIVCMKEMQLTSIASGSLSTTYTAKLRLIAEEINMIMTINHPNIVRYFGIEKYKRTIYICMEYCLSTVNEFLNDIRSFQKRAHITRKNSLFCSDSSEQDEPMSTEGIIWHSSLDVNETVRGFVRQLLNALMVLHEYNIVHCDVKGDNIFIANDAGKYIVKLGDFNLSHRLDLGSTSTDGSDARSTQKGTIYFKPPEPEYVYKSDIWALGCTIIEMLTGKLPWSNAVRSPDDKIYIQNQLLAKKGPPIPDDLKNQTEAYHFIQLCLQVDLEQRPSARDLLNHPYSRVSTDN